QMISGLGPLQAAWGARHDVPPKGNKLRTFSYMLYQFIHNGKNCKTLCRASPFHSGRSRRQVRGIRGSLSQAFPEAAQSDPINIQSQGEEEEATPEPVGGRPSAAPLPPAGRPRAARPRSPVRVVEKGARHLLENCP